MQDIFNADSFTIVSLTDEIMKLPFIPGRAGVVVDWDEKRVATTSIVIESKQGVLHLINPTPRGGIGVAIDKQKGNVRSLLVPHYQIQGGVWADEVQNVREFGTEDRLKTVMSMVNEVQREHVVMNLDPTLEYQRIGALKGIILNADGSTLYNLFTEFGVSPPADVNFPFSTTTSTGAVRGAFQDVVDAMADELGGMKVGKVGAFAGKNWWKAFIAAKEVRETYTGWAAAAALRQGTPYESVFEFGDVEVERYRGSIPYDGTPVPFIGDNEARFFYKGVPGLYRTVYAPADYNETVNTLGLPRYSRLKEFENKKGWEIESQMNALSYCKRPGTLVKGTFTTP